MATTPLDPLDPTAPKKKPAPTASQASALDTGIPAPAAPATGVPAPAAGTDRGASTGLEQAPAAPAIASPTPAAPMPPTGVTAEQGITQIQQDSIARGGRQLNPTEMQQLATQVGAPQGPNGTYTAQQLATARDLISRYSFNPADPFGALPESAPGSTSSLANRRLTELLGTNFNEVDPNSQAIQQPLGAFRASNQRATDRARMAMSLRNQNQGISGGGEEVGLLGLLEDQGVKEGAYESNLIAGELATKRQALTQAIELATQVGQQNRARQLQEELAKLDLQLRQKLGEGQLALGARSLSQNDQQFLDSLGFNYANLQASQNNRAIEALLGG